MKAKASTGLAKRKCNYEKKQTTLDACHQQRVQAFGTSNEGAGGGSSEIDYYTKTADILFAYYDSIEKAPAGGTAAAETPPQGGIMDFFSRLRKRSVDSGAAASPPPEPATAPVATVATVPVAAAPAVNKAALFDRYLAATDEDYVKSTADENAAPGDVLPCEHCQSTHMTILMHECMVFCNECASVSYIIVDNDKPSYKEPQKEITYLNYKRKNHFNEWLNQIQGKETTDIPEDVFHCILLEIKKLKITNLADITHTKIRDILKKLKFSKYYEHTPYIYYRITGIPNQTFPQDLEEKLRNMFEQVQVPFNRHVAPPRKNFMSYSYCIHKMLQLLGEDQYLHLFPLLRSRAKVAEVDAVWRKICEELHWEFIPSL